MKINPIQSNPTLITNKNMNTNKKDQGDVKKVPEDRNSQKDVYTPSPAQDKQITYDKPKAKIDHETIQKLKVESEEAFNSLRQIVRELLSRQGMTFEELKDTDTVIVDEQARLEAQKAIGEGGEFSPEKVSDHIFEFAKAISGGDKSKFETIKEAINKGFEAAEKAFGGKLPDISYETHDLIMEKLTNWVEDKES